MICAIMAFNKVFTVGDNGGIPWYRPADMARFRERTKGHVVVMGRKTYDSIGKPLEGRINRVVSSGGNIQGVEVYSNVLEALSTVEGRDVFIIGGPSLLNEAIPFVEVFYATVIEDFTDGDTKIDPEILKDWYVSSKETLPDGTSVEHICVRGNLPYPTLFQVVS